MRQKAVGTVTRSRVSLRRVTPLVGSVFQPIFIGKFEERNGSVVLVGHFTVHWFEKVFMSVWLGGVLLWTAIVVVAVAYQRSLENLIFPVLGAGMFCAGVAFARFCKLLSRNGTAWLSNVIGSALSESRFESSERGRV